MHRRTHARHQRAGMADDVAGEAVGGAGGLQRRRAAIVRRRACGYHPRAQSYAQGRDILDDARLLDANAMAALFPGAVIEHGRFAGLTKSLIAIR